MRVDGILVEHSNNLGVAHLVECSTKPPRIWLNAPPRRVPEPGVGSLGKVSPLLGSSTFVYSVGMGDAKGYPGGNLTAGLCDSCAHQRLIATDRGSRFTLCELSKSDDRFAKYPRLPVVSCLGYAATTQQDALPSL